MERDKGSAHPQFDLEAARKEFGKIRDLEGEQITSPFDLYSVETLRDKHRLRSEPAFATDVFVWGIGAPKLPYLTKISGLPYWPKSKPWPIDDQGNPMKFLAQFCLRDSRDLVRSAPGELLLMFVPSEGDEWLWEPSQIRFEWLTIGKEPILKEFPRGVTSYGVNEWYGVIYRTADYPSAEENDDVASGYDLPILNATKIGGVPHGIQSDSAFTTDAKTGLPVFSLETNFGKVDAAFLGQLTSLQAAPEVAYPWTNRKEPLGLEFDETGIYDEALQCMFGDMGSIYVYLLEDGQCVASMECY